MKTKITIERGEAEIEAEVEFDYHRAHQGHRDSLGCPEEPDEPAELEFVEATADGVDVELTDDELEKAEQQAWKDISDAEGCFY